MIIGRLKGIVRCVVALLVFVFWGQYLWRNWDSLTTYRWQLDFSWLALSFLVGVIYWVLAAVIWQHALISVGGSLGLGSAIRLWVMSMLGRYVPGGVWHIAGRVYMAEKAGESGVAVFVSTVMEQILYVLSILLMLLVSSPFWDADYSRLAPALLLVLPLALAIHPAVIRRLTSLATRFASRRKASGAGDLPSALAAVNASLPTPGYGSLFVLLMLYLSSCVLPVAILYLSAAAVGPVSGRQLPAFVGAFAVAWIAGYFSLFAPSGLGVREGVITLILTPVVGAPVAVAASTLSRLAISFGEAAVVAGVWGIGVRGRETEVGSRGSGDERRGRGAEG